MYFVCLHYSCLECILCAHTSKRKPCLSPRRSRWRDAARLHLAHITGAQLRAFAPVRIPVRPVPRATFAGSTAWLTTLTKLQLIRDVQISWQIRHLAQPPPRPDIRLSEIPLICHYTPNVRGTHRYRYTPTAIQTNSQQPKNRIAGLLVCSRPSVSSAPDITSVVAGDSGFGSSLAHESKPAEQAS